MIADFALITVALWTLIIIARFNRLLQALLQSVMTQLLGKDLIGSLKTARSARRPQALPTQE